MADSQPAPSAASASATSAADSSPFATPPYDLAVQGTNAMIDDVLRDKLNWRRPGGTDGGESRGGEGERKPHHRPWYKGYIHGVNIITLFSKLFEATWSAAHANRYRLPPVVYLALFFTLFLTAIGHLGLAVHEAIEIAQPAMCLVPGSPYVVANVQDNLARACSPVTNGHEETLVGRGTSTESGGVTPHLQIQQSQCEVGFQSQRAYRMLVRGLLNGLPNLITLVVVMFPALYRP